MKKAIMFIILGFIFINLYLFLNINSFQAQAQEIPVKQAEIQDKISKIEEVFVQKGLKQYGYDIFNGKITPSGSQIQGAYRIKEGDKLSIYFWGDSIDLLSVSASGFLNPVNTVTVDSQGNTYIQGVGMVSVKAKTPSEAEKAIANILSRKIDNFKVKVNVLNSENFPVIITGNVKNPGTFYINNDISVIEILALAGGVEKDGSLRNILHVSGNKRSQIDLYDFLIKGKPYKALFKKGDVILVNPIENVVAISSGVKRPAIYEFKQGETLKDLITYAGDILPSVNKDMFTVGTFSGQNSKRKLIKNNFSKMASIYPHNGDIVEFRTMFDLSGNIEVSGCITKPGFIPYRENMTLKNILNLVNFKEKSEEKADFLYINNSLVDEIDINNVLAEISTKSDDGTPQIKTVYLYELLTRNQEDLKLKPDDKILFRQLGENENLKTVEVLGYVKNPGILRLSPDMKLVDALKLAGGPSREGYLRGLVLLRPSISEEQKKILEKVALDLNKGVLEAENQPQIMPEQDKNFLETQKELVEIMQKKANNEYGRISLNIKTSNLEELSEQENIMLQDGDKIYIPIKPQHIMIVGEVLNPSAIAFSSGKTFNNYIDDVGGLTKEADKRKIYITKANGFTQRVTNPAKISLEPGDSIIIPRKISKPIDWFDFSKTFSSVVANTLNSIFIITKI